MLSDARKRCWACGEPLQQVETITVGAEDAGPAERAVLTPSDKKMFGDATKQFEWGDR